MTKMFYIGAAGAMGAIARVAVGQFITNGSGFPTATLLVNVVGTFLLCLLTARVVKKVKLNRELYDIVTIGFFGSFTTFSALSMETMNLFEKGHIVIAFLYIVSSIIGGLSAAMFGFHIGGKRWNDEPA